VTLDVIAVAVVRVPDAVTLDVIAVAVVRVPDAVTLDVVAAAVIRVPDAVTHGVLFVRGVGGLVLLGHGSHLLGSWVRLNICG
jgi:hypothetical protein